MTEGEFDAPNSTRTSCDVNYGSCRRVSELISQFTQDQENLYTTTAILPIENGHFFGRAKQFGYYPIPPDQQ